jgi:hypothetical protein
MKAKEVYCGIIQFFTRTFDKLDFSVRRQTTVRPLHDPEVKAVGNAELEDMATALLNAAHASGQTITIESKSVPPYGMGGYAPQVKIHPNYASVRAAMDALQARRDGTAKPPAQLKYDPEHLPQPLKARLIPWPDADAELQDALSRDPRHLPHHVLVRLVKEYDRRLMQMWDKVGFERQHNLVSDFQNSVPVKLREKDSPSADPTSKPITVSYSTSVGDLSKMLSLTSQQLIQRMISLKMRQCTISNRLSFDEIKKIALSFGYISRLETEYAMELVRTSDAVNGGTAAKEDHASGT